MKVVAIVQARMESTRLPKKVMLPVEGITIIELLLSRLSQAQSIEQIVVAIPDNSENKVLAEHVRQLGYTLAFGSEEDVLDRYYQAAKANKADIVIRITGDCPLVDAKLVDTLVNEFKQAEVDYLSNTITPTYPDGLDIEIFTFDALEKSWKETKDLFDREHVTPYLRTSGKFCIQNFSHDTDYSNERWTVDEPNDVILIENILKHFSPQTDFQWDDVIKLRNLKPQLFKVNQNIKRNEGTTMGKGQKLWARAKRVIPGGNMLLSKRAEMFLPDQWPAYFSKAKGCKVWDLDGKEYIDMSIMGIGTNILGYGHPEVDEAVHNVVNAGNMSTFNCPEEVYLAEKLIELHPWADMVRFARTGGEANSISIRIARAASGKDNVAFCGYHGWHDWYLSANLGDEKNLNGHLLPGLDPKGVPENLRGTIYPFKYNDYAELETLVRNKDIGIIKMEVSRNSEPEENFLQKVRQLANDRNIILIFDECTSGFRQSFGGLHKLYGVEPDIAVFGKALGNGYAITATIGRREIMEAAQTTFISSTFWTERIGPTAALQTLKVMEKEKSWDYITNTGKDITKNWQKLAEKYNLSITTNGLPSLTGFSFNSDNALAYKTLITQEMLTQGYLAGTSVYVCTEHSPEIVKTFFEKLEPIFALIKDCEDGRDVFKLLHGPVCHGGFQRLN